MGRRGRATKQEEPAWLARRLRAAEIFAAGGRQADVVKELGVSPEAARQWQLRWREEGEEGLRRMGSRGPQPRLGPEELERLTQELLQGPQEHGYTTSLWTLSRIAEVIEKILGIRYHKGHVWRIMRQMGWSCQKPQRRAKERDEAEIARWVKEDWPRIKRGPKKTRA